MSNKKPLLTENTVRRFMKLAEISKLSEEFVDGMFEQEDELGDELPPGPEMGADEEGPEEEPAPELGGEEGEPGLEGEINLSPDEGEELVSAIVDAIAEKIPNLDLSVERGEGIEGEEPGLEEPALGAEEPDLGGEEPAGLGGEEEVPPGMRYEGKAGLADKGPNNNLGSKSHPDMRNKKLSGAGLASQGPGLVKEDEEGDEDAIAEVVDDEEIVAEVARRVADRILKGLK